MTADHDLAQLHTTLPLGELISLFANEIEEFVEYDSFEYAHDSRDIYFNRGDRSTHTCHYHVKDQGLDLGEITLTRQVPFREEEMIIIERALGSLTIHLMNALDSQTKLQNYQSA